jgi:hypothetical protein
MGQIEQVIHKNIMPATADNRRLALIPLGKSPGFTTITLMEDGCRLRQSKTLKTISVHRGWKDEG